MAALHIHWQTPIPFKKWEVKFVDFPAEGLSRFRQEFVFQQQGIYMIYTRRKIIYIGMTYNQDFRTRFMQHRADESRMNCIRYNVAKVGASSAYVKIGLFREQYSLSRIKDAENLLLCCIQPPCCKYEIDSYNGRVPMNIVNSGNYGPLRNAYSTDGLGL
ncbi:hypothetical protein MUP77_21755 [Candidatus Bathyarchaeota archaeon]|nr:hypothetical protein [Candidatus Bathyarchaeota archaeon]